MPAELPPQADQRPAAVLCLLFESAGEANVVLTRRPVHLRSHAGEVCFPGGRLRRGEIPVEAALREANEEIGAVVADIEVIGQLTPLTTSRSPALVHCFVGKLSAPDPRARRSSPTRTRSTRSSGCHWRNLQRAGHTTKNCGPRARQAKGRLSGRSHFSASMRTRCGEQRAACLPSCWGLSWAAVGKLGCWRMLGGPEEAQRLAGRYPGQIMMCPRCGIYNQSGRSSCSRCSGLLAPAPVSDDRPLPPVLPVTKRAELAMGRASSGAALGAAGDATSLPSPTLGAALETAALPLTEIYLMEMDRSTGQPAPPPSPHGQGEPARADRPTRVAIGLSRA